MKLTLTEVRLQTEAQLQAASAKWLALKLPKTAKCAWCDRTFIKTKPHRRFCGYSCSAKWRNRQPEVRAAIKRALYTSVPVACAQCGATVMRKPSELRDSVHVRAFCSRECSWVGTAASISAAKKGHETKEETKAKLRLRRGPLAAGWKGGRPLCPICGKQISYKSARCGKHKIWTQAHRRNQARSSSATKRGRMPVNMQRPGQFQNIRRGWFDINGRRLFFRSKWEANYALYLDFLISKGTIKSWSYEPDVFTFEKIKFGTRSYRPDFKIECNNGSFYYDEIKGWLDPKSKTKLRRMKKYFPAVDLRLVGRKQYLALAGAVGKMLKFF